MAGFSGSIFAALLLEIMGIEVMESVKANHMNFSWSKQARYFALRRNLRNNEDYLAIRQNI